jgi:hypothetical protein
LAAHYQRAQQNCQSSGNRSLETKISARIEQPAYVKD